MSKQKIVAVRQSKSNTQQMKVKLSQIQLSEDADYCHRDREALKEEQVEGLMRNIVSSGGIRTPFLVARVESPAKSKEEVFILVGGRRRFEAIRAAINNKFESTLFHDDMEVPITVMVPDPNQSDEEFKQELFLASVADNDQRKDFSAAERFGIVTKMLDLRVPSGRAAMEMGISRTQYERLEIVAEREWLRSYVLDQCITHTDAATLLDSCKVGEKKNRKMDNKRVERFKSHFTKWVDDARRSIAEEDEHLKGIDKKLTESQKLVKSRLSSTLVRYWCECLKEGKPLSNVTPRFFRIDFDSEKRTITLPKREFKMDKLSVSECRTIIRELNSSLDQFLSILKQRQASEAAEKPLSKKERDAELAAIMADGSVTSGADGKDAGSFHRDATPRMIDVDTNDTEEVE